MEIPGVAFVMIGGIVLISSILVPELLFFVFVGIGFIIYGGFKMFRGKPKKRHEQPKYHICRACHRPVHLNANFCPYCGASVKYHRSHPHFHEGGHNQHYYRNDNHVRRVP